MKKPFTRNLVILYALLVGLFMLCPQNARGGEFVIMNRTYTYPADGGAFDCHVKSYGSMPSNWLYPDDYWNGHFYGYFQLIDIPSNYTVGFQMGIYQYYKYNGIDYYETCSLVQAQLQGAGDVTEVDYGSPANWWQHPNGGVDFTKVNEFEEVGLAIWSHMPGHEGIICPTSSGGDDIAYEVHDQFMPCTIRVIVVAVSAGSSFSGWDNYMNGGEGGGGGGGGGGCTPAQQATPAYNIDYRYETTDKVVPTTDEYSLSSDMSGAVSGNGQSLHLTPGQDVYFRTKASGECWLTSDIQHLTVPYRPETPAFTIDFGNEKTSEVVSTDIEYSASAAYTDVVSGTGDKITLTPGQDLYFWVKNTSSSFYSNVFHLVVPARPTTPQVTIDFVNEMTNENITSDIEYSASASYSNIISGTGAKIALSPGQDLYFWEKVTSSSFYSQVFHLVNPNRPDAPSVSIDYVNERTNEAIPTIVEYSIEADMGSAQAGINNQIPLTPGQDLYFRQMAGSSSYISGISHLVVPQNNILDYSGPDTITENKFTVQAILADAGAAFNLTNLVVTNGEARNLQEGNIFDIYPSLKGPVSVIIPANAVSNNSFASNQVQVYYDSDATGIPKINRNTFSIYPNPSHTGKVHINSKMDMPYTIDIYSATGGFIRTLSLNRDRNQQIDLQDLRKGMYFLKIHTNNGVMVEKIVLE